MDGFPVCQSFRLKCAEIEFLSLDFGAPLLTPPNAGFTPHISQRSPDDLACLTGLPALVTWVSWVRGQKTVTGCRPLRCPSRRSRTHVAPRLVVPGLIGWGEWADGRSASEEYSLTFENGRMKVSAHRAFNTGDPTDYVLDMDSVGSVGGWPGGVFKGLSDDSTEGSWATETSGQTTGRPGGASNNPNSLEAEKRSEQGL